MRVILFITGLKRGGAERQVMDLCQEFRRQGMKTCIVSLGAENDFKDYSKYGIISLGINLKNIIRIKSVLRLWVCYRKFRPIVIHGHMFHANIFTRILGCFDRKVKTINTAHTHYEGSIFRYFLYKSTSRFCDLFTTVSKYSADILARRYIFPLQARVIYNGIKTSKFEIKKQIYEPQKIFRIGIFSRLESEKNIDFVVDAYAESSFLRSNTKLVVHGNGNRREKIEKKIQDSFLGNIIELVPAINLTGEIYGAYDLVLVPSNYESFSLVALEAIVSERCVLCTELTGIGHDFENLVFTFKNNNIQSLENCVKKIHDKIMYNAEDVIAKNNFKKNQAKQLDIENIASQWVNLYK